MLGLKQSKDHPGIAPIFSVVLAGGRSMRMGQDKRFLKLGGKYLVDRAVVLGAEISGNSRDRVFLCGSVPGRECIPDVVLGIGPLGGILAAADHMEKSGVLRSNPWVVVFPIDMPLLKSEVFSPLLDLIFHGLPSKYTAVSYQGFEMPFVFRCNLRARNLLGSICRDQDSSQRSIRHFLESIGTLHVDFDIKNRKAMFNANSPADWKRVTGKMAYEY